MFLIKLIKMQNYFLPNLENITLGDEILNSFEIDKINIEVLLFQAACLTIDEQIQKMKYYEKYENKGSKISYRHSF